MAHSEHGWEHDDSLCDVPYCTKARFRAPTSAWRDRAFSAGLIPTRNFPLRAICSNHQRMNLPTFCGICGVQEYARDKIWERHGEAVNDLRQCHPDRDIPDTILACSACVTEANKFVHALERQASTQTPEESAPTPMDTPTTSTSTTNTSASTSTTPANSRKRRRDPDEVIAEHKTRVDAYKAKLDPQDIPELAASMFSSMRLADIPRYDCYLAIGAVVGREPDSVRKLVARYNGGERQFTETRAERLGHNARLKRIMMVWIKFRMKQKGKSMKAAEFVEAFKRAVHIIVPEERSRAVGVNCAREYLAIVLNLKWTFGRKIIYFDGHERADVKAARLEFCHNLMAWSKRERLFVMHNNVLTHVDTLSDSDLVRYPPDQWIFDPAVPVAERVVVIVHDEATAHSNDRERMQYVDMTGKMGQVKPKSQGERLHYSAFLGNWGLPATTNPAHIADLVKLYNEVHDIQVTDEVVHAKSRVTKKDSIQADNLEGVHTGVAVETIGLDATWTGDQLIDQSRVVIQLLKKLYGDIKVICVFDNAPSHHKRAADGLDASKMNLRPGGAQPIMRDGWFLTDKHVKVVQRMYDMDSMGQKVAKGTAKVLRERGIETHGVTLDQQRELLAAYPDFQEECSLLVQLWRDAGYDVAFLPKFHPELSGIEQVWAWLKARLREVADNNFLNFVKSSNRILKLLRTSPIYQLMCYKFMRKARRYAAEYETGKTGFEVLGCGSVSSHRRVRSEPSKPPRSAAVPIDTRRARSDEIRRRKRVAYYSNQENTPAAVVDHGRKRAQERLECNQLLQLDADGRTTINGEEEINVDRPPLRPRRLCDTFNSIALALRSQ